MRREWKADDWVTDKAQAHGCAPDGPFRTGGTTRRPFSSQ